MASRTLFFSPQKSASPPSCPTHPWRCRSSSQAFTQVTSQGPRFSSSLGRRNFGRGTHDNLLQDFPLSAKFLFVFCGSGFAAVMIGSWHVLRNVEWNNAMVDLHSSPLSDLYMPTEVLSACSRQHDQGYPSRGILPPCQAQFSSNCGHCLEFSYIFFFTLVLPPPSWHWTVCGQLSSSWCKSSQTDSPSMSTSGASTAQLASVKEWQHFCHYEVM